MLQLEEMVDPSILVDVKVDKRGARIVVSGTSKNVLAAQDAIHRQCKEYQREKNAKIEADILYNQIRWHFEEITATEIKLIEYGKNPNLKIETAYKGNKDSVELKDTEGKIYVVDFKDLVEYPKDDKTDKVLVIRKDILKGEIHFYSPYTIHWKQLFCIRPCSKTPLTIKILSSFLIPKVLKKYDKKFENRLTNKN